MKNGRIKGVLSPVVTPFKSRSLARSPSGSSATAGGCSRRTSGSPSSARTARRTRLSVDERIALLDALVAAGLDPARMMPGTGCCALTDTVRLTAHAVKAGCAGVLMLPPFYYKGVSDDGLFRSFAEVIERVGDRAAAHLPLPHPAGGAGADLAGLIERLLKAYPGQRRGHEGQLRRLGQHEGRARRVRRSPASTCSWQRDVPARVMRGGAAGCISATANVNPGPIARLHATWQAADADAQQQRLDEIRGVMQSYVMIPALKIAIAHWSKDPAWTTVRPPLVAAHDGAGRRMIAKLEGKQFEMPGLT